MYLIAYKHQSHFQAIFASKAATILEFIFSSSIMSSTKQGFYSRIKLTPNNFRRMMNWWPPFWVMRVHVMSVSPDWCEASVRMKLSFRNKNFTGSHFGGGLFSRCDSLYMIMLMQILGKDYVVWDKAAAIQFVAPGRGTVFAHFKLTVGQIAEIRSKTANGEKFAPAYRVNVVDDAGKIIAIVDKTIYIRKSPRCLRKTRPVSAKMQSC